MSRSARSDGLTTAGKARLALRVWNRFLKVRKDLRDRELPAYVEELGRIDSSEDRLPIWRVSGAVDRCLRLAGRRPPCLQTSLVLFRLLREQGDPAELVIGLPDTAPGHEAHAWVEVGGVDVGPTPGRNGHEEMARFS
jgi:hypothetical protein